jgi:hypothetical protein
MGFLKPDLFTRRCDAFRFADLSVAYSLRTGEDARRFGRSV